MHDVEVEDIEDLAPVAWETTANNPRIGIARYSKAHLALEGASTMLCGVRWPNVLTTNFGHSHEGRCERCYAIASDPVRLDRARDRLANPKPPTPAQLERRRRTETRRALRALLRDM